MDKDAPPPIEGREGDRGNNGPGIKAVMGARKRNQEGRESH